MKILVAGELNPDLILQGYQKFPTLGQEVLVDDLSLTLGSASAICAAGLARLGHEVTFCGKLGYDNFGDVAEQFLTKLGVSSAYVIRDQNIKTGITVSITGTKDRALVTYLGSIAALKASDLQDEWLKGVRHLHISSYYLQHALRPDLKSLFGRAHAHGVTTSLDPGFDPAEQWTNGLEDVLKETDLFFPNEVELEGITGTADPVEALRRLQNGRTLVVAKLGAHGAMALDPDGSVVRVPAFAITPVDTTGAGDSFNAGFMHAWLDRRPLLDCLRFAAACGAISTQGLGGTGAQPDVAQAEQFLASRQPTDVAAG